MSIRQRPIYWVECDFPGCIANSSDGTDYVGLIEVSQATAELDEIGWITVPRENYDTHYCEAHWHWCDRCEDEKVPSIGNAPRYCPSCQAELKSEEPVDEPG